ncbi:MAG: universal stress protein, partial [Terriglobales bacterium]
QLLLMHVSKETPQTQSERQRIVDGGKQRLASLIPAGMQLAAPSETIVDFGTAADCILTVAQQRKPGLIVLGVRQPVGFVRRLKWATAYEVVANAPCPVLTVRMSEPE